MCRLRRGAGVSFTSFMSEVRRVGAVYPVIPNVLWFVVVKRELS